MGLDYSIELHVKELKTHKEYDIEMGYWRKFWTLRDKLCHLLKNSKSVIRTETDFLIELNIDAMPDIINFLAEEVKDRESECFSDSIWHSSAGRRLTCRELEDLVQWDDILAAIPELRMYEDKKERQAILAELDDTITYLKNDQPTYGPVLDLTKMLLNIEDYKLTIRSYNSY